MICNYCRGEDVSADATVRWDYELQEWYISGVHDGDWCDECQGECTIVEESPSVDDMEL